MTELQVLLSMPGDEVQDRQRSSTWPFSLCCQSSGPPSLLSIARWACSSDSRDAGAGMLLKRMAAMPPSHARELELWERTMLRGGML